MKLPVTILAILFSQLLSALIYVSQKTGSQNGNGKKQNRLTQSKIQLVSATVSLPKIK